MKKFCMINTCILLCFVGLTVAAEQQKLPAASADKLPRWRGFNLLEKFSKDWSNKPFNEEDFKLISSLGFNFVRLPLDYRVWIKDGDWTKFDEAVLKEIDQAVAWGRKYGIHVCINLHRAPGYCVNPPKEKLDLWKDPEAQRVCAIHWGMFARRYRGIPNKELSFDLLNEPSINDEQTYFKVAKILVEAIRKEDPNRLVIADGLQWGTKPAFDLVPLKIAQSTRGYSPMEISHYKASWVNQSDAMPVPRWPACSVNSYLYGSGKKEIASSLPVTGNFPAGTGIRIRVDIVSGQSTLVIRADGREILRKQFICGPGTGEWAKVEYKAEWKIYQNTYNRDYSVVLAAPAKKIEITNAEGDWMTFSEIGITMPGGKGSKGEYVIGSSAQWGAKHKAVSFDPANEKSPFQTGAPTGAEWLWKNNIEPWQKLEATKTGVMVGEWGAYNKTPHDVALRWMGDCLANWKKADWGWALWNFRGSFGILDSERTDVTYEDFHGHKLDRKMLELLQNN